MGQASALTAALNSGQTTNKAGPTAISSSSTVSSAFPCLYQDENSAEDAFEVDIDLNKLRLGASPGISQSNHRKSLDGPQVWPIWSSNIIKLPDEAMQREALQAKHLLLIFMGERDVQRVSLFFVCTFCFKAHTHFAG